MDALPAFLALNGVLIVGVSSIAGLLLYKTLLAAEDPHDWHLLHAGGSARGVLLIALGGTIHLAHLSPGAMTLGAGLITLFVWVSTIAMALRGLYGQTGFSFKGALANRLGFVLYAVGVISVFPGLAILAWGFLRAV